MSKCLIILFFFFTSIDIKAQQNSLNEDTLLSTSYFQQHQINNITFVSLLKPNWIKENPAFDTLMNARYFRFIYNSKGLCTQMSWMFCHWDSTSLQLDTSMSSIENFFKFKYKDSTLINLDVFSFSEINNVIFMYKNNDIIRLISYIQSTGEIKVKKDTVLSQIKYIQINDPFKFAIYPTFELQNISTLWENNFLLNQMPVSYFDEHLKNRKILLQLCPIMAALLDIDL